MEEANSSRNDDFHVPDIPSDDWPMNAFLNELADDLTDEDLKKMKYLLTGLNGTGKGVLEQIKDPLDLFEYLRQRRFLTHDNIVLLQAMLWLVKRKDLHNKFVKFARQRGNIVHFFPATDKPENGFEYIRFHIGGKEKLDRHKLEKLRLLVSQTICIPLEFVLAAGIEATNSILVTFMVPVGYANVIFDLDDEDRGYLGSEGVDAVWCNGKTINCSDFICTIQDESIKKDEEVKILINQKSKLEKEVENLQIIGLRHSKRIRQSEENHRAIQQEAEQRIATITSKLIQEFIGLKYTPEAMSLQSIALKNSLKWFNHIIKKMETLNYDTELIRDLLEANSTVTRLKVKSNHAWIESQQKQRIVQLEDETEILKYERSKLTYFLKVGISEPVLTQNEDFFIHLMSSICLTQFTQTTEVAFSHEKKDTDQEAQKQVLTEVFKAFEDTLNESEIRLLISKYLPSQADQKNYRQSNLRLLEYLWSNYAKQNDNELANIQKWMVLVLASIKRMDLYDYWAQKSNLLIKALLAESTTDDEHSNDNIGAQEVVEQTTASKEEICFDNSKSRKSKRQKRRTPLLLEGKDDKTTSDETLQRIENKIDKLLYCKTLEEKNFLELANEKPKYDLSKLFQSKLMK